MADGSQLELDAERMRCAVEAAEAVRGTTAPNPWVGAALVTAGGSCHLGATEPPPGRHAERVALDAATAAGDSADGGTMYTTLEPCSHQGRTSACASALVDGRVARVVVGVEDPDPLVAGQGLAALRAAGVEVALGVERELVAEQLGPYLHHRRTGRPWVVLKLAATADGRTTAPDGSSQWITGPEARADGHRLRARCDSVLVGAGTVRADDPQLTVRGTSRVNPARFAKAHDPRRFVLGSAPEGAKVHPCEQVSGQPAEVLQQLGADGVVELLVEGGATVAGLFHSAGLVDEYVLYLAPALAGDGLPLLGGAAGTGEVRDQLPSIDDIWRGELVDVTQLGGDVRITMRPRRSRGSDDGASSGIEGAEDANGAQPEADDTARANDGSDGKNG